MIIHWVYLNLTELMKLYTCYYCGLCYWCQQIQVAYIIDRNLECLAVECYEDRRKKEENWEWLMCKQRNNEVVTIYEYFANELSTNMVLQFYWYF